MHHVLLARYLVIASICFCFYLLSKRRSLLNYLACDSRPFTLPGLDIEGINRLSSEYRTYPLQPPYNSQFWEAGKRLRSATKWLYSLDSLNEKAPARHDLTSAIESVTVNLVPFLPARSGTPFQNLRSSFTRSKGIVIPVRGGHESIRFAGHLIRSLRMVLRSELPIQIAYAGEDDFSQRHRDVLSHLAPMANVSFLNVLSYFDDFHLRLGKGQWAIKPYAALASRFEQVILLDVDSILLQKPDSLLEHQAFRSHGAFLFYDRHNERKTAAVRHDLPRDGGGRQLPNIRMSRAQTPSYAEELDSGVVVVDKGRPEVLMGLLHICWQNTYQVRSEVTFGISYQNKGSWWQGLELTGSGYGYEKDPGVVIGWGSPCAAYGDRNLAPAHVDENGDLIWYSGGSLRSNLGRTQSFGLPEVWRISDRWIYGVTGQGPDCMTRASIKPLNQMEIRALMLNMEAADYVDEILEGVEGL
ncbi:mannosyltransferase putative-domain-containing protein [Emericellopsis atlantica]|uniref:Mannosyltransferase putative-domain-containing protein n=1 Tax=Emericellopsis atlantica TaxID=2614577 RepID=A0A9P7ZDY8_9HYPO|nr:mannosyltransferase putative-domain-containing protein [Emericellopsis atlantica]KAG9249966.1 mannosyltransferase putative-domain-containing protein [Emericellopsis atlantica]